MCGKFIYEFMGYFKFSFIIIELGNLHVKLLYIFLLSLFQIISCFDFFVHPFCYASRQNERNIMVEVGDFYKTK
jgi:hypothetical protein